MILLRSSVVGSESEGDWGVILLNKTRLVWLLLLVSLITAVGCYGSSDPEVEQPTAVAAATVCPSTTEIVAQEGSLIAEINRYRQSQGLEPLIENTQIAAAARWKAIDMAVNEYFSHGDSLGRDAFKMMSDFGFDDNTWKGENLAAGVKTSLEVLETLKGSPEHNGNLLSPNYGQVGVGLACQPGSTYSYYWAIELAGAP